MLSNLIPDLRYTLRGFARRPAFAVIIILTLGCGIAVNAAVLSLMERTLFRPMAVNEPAALVNITASGPQVRSVSNNAAGPLSHVFSYPMFRDLQNLQESFVGLAAHRAIDANIAFDGQSISAQAMLVSGNYFSLLGVAPAAGRTLGEGDEGAAAETAMLSYDYWQNSLGADPTVVGRTLIVNGRLLTIVGIAAKDFFGTTLGIKPAVFLPLSFPPRPELDANNAALNDRTYAWLYLFARLLPGVSLQNAQSAINAPYRAILNNVEAPQMQDFSPETTERFRNKSITLLPGARGQSVLPGQAQTPLTIALIVTGIVLAIASVNIAGLTLARGATRAGEFAVRATLGAARSRLVSLMLVESLTLAIAAVVLAMPLTMTALRGISLLLRNDSFARNLSFTPDANAFAYGTGLALLAVIVFGLIPALKLARTNPGPALQKHNQRSSSARGIRRFRTTLATTQVALSTVLLVLAGLFAQSLWNIARVDLGISTESLATFTISPGRNGYTPDQSALLFDEIEQEIATLPGVSASASALVPLLADSNSGVGIAVEGHEPEPDSDRTVLFNMIGPGFFGTVGVPLLRGRDFSAADTRSSPPVAIVNERFAERYGLGANAIGTRMRIGFFDGRDAEIIGLVRDSKYSTVKDPIPAQLFLSRHQAPFPINDLSFYVNGNAGFEPARLLGSLRQAVANVDPTLPVTELRTVDQQVRVNIADDRLLTLLASALATLATVLAALGLYGVLSYTVAQRTREIGLRLALGAGRPRLRRMIFSQVWWIGVAGGLAGIVIAAALGRMAAGLLFELSASFVPAYLVATAVLATILGAAACVPARRASRIDPMEALRTD